MSMKFVFENVNDRGIKKHKIVSIEGVLDKDELPSAYVYINREDDVIWRSDRGVQYWDKNSGYQSVYPGHILTFEQTERLLEIARRAGHRLHEINTSIKKEMAHWEGEKWEVRI